MNGVFFALWACTAEKTTVFENTEWGEAVVCNDPLHGFDRLTESGEKHGLNFVQNEEGHTGGGGSGVYMQDLDGDGDLDLVFGNADRVPYVFLNDGKGFFEEVKDSVPVRNGPGGGGGAAMSLADMDGDGLPELFAAANGILWIYHNDGNGHFSAEAPVWTSSMPYMIPGTLSLGDFDRDGDLDLLVAGLEWIEEECQLDHSCPGDPPNAGSPQLLFRNDDGAWNQILQLLPYGQTAYSVAATFTDRDMDGDEDLLLLQDQGANGKFESPPAAFYRNDGLTLEGAPFLENDAPSRGANTPASGMGIATQDVNQDGWFDYCFSDTGPIHCLLSDGIGNWYDAGIALGLSPKNVGNAEIWSAWSIEWVDLDNDGFLDMAAAGGRPTGEHAQDTTYADALFSGNPDGSFTDQSIETGFSSTEDHFGMAAGDLDGDGFLELVVATSYGRPQLWWNHCSDAHWLEVSLKGSSFNRDAIGAKVFVEAGELAFTQELQSTRAQGQSSLRLHFGLGAEEYARVRVVWPDGKEDLWEKVPTDRRIQLEW